MSLEEKLNYNKKRIVEALVLIQRAVVLSYLLGDDREPRYMDLLTEIEILEKKYDIHQNDVIREERAIDKLSTNEIFDLVDNLAI